MEPMIAFRTERKGFNKEDVLKYIERLSQQFADQERCYLSTIRRLEGELAAAHEANSAQVQAADDTSSAAMAEKEAQIAALSTENQALSEQVDKLKKELCEAAERNKEAAASGNDEQYSYQIGNIMLRAGLEADRIVAEAKATASDVVADAERQAEQTRTEAAEKAKAAIDRTGEKCALAAERYANDMKQLSNDTSAAYLSLCDRLTRQIDALNEDLKRHIEA